MLSRLNVNYTGYIIHARNYKFLCKNDLQKGMKNFILCIKHNSQLTFNAELYTFNKWAL